MRRLLLGIIGLLALSSCASAPTHPAHEGDVRSMRITATVGPDGVVSVTNTVTFDDDQGGKLVLRAPALGNIEGRTLDGAGRSGSGTEVTLDVPDRTATVAYKITGAAERYRDVTQVEIPVWAGIAGLTRLAAPGIPVELDLVLPSRDGTVIWHGVTDAGAGAVEKGKGPTRANVVPARSSTIVVQVPSSATPALPVLRDEDRGAYLLDRQSSAIAADERLADDVAAARDRARLIDGAYWGLVGLCIAVPILITLIRLARAAGRRRKATADVPGLLREQPDQLNPATVALIGAGGHDIGPEAAAATVLDLADRKHIRIDATGGGAWRMDLAKADIDADSGEAALVAALRAAAPDGTMTGPPLPISWGPWWKAIRRSAVGEARANGLLARRYPSGLFVTAVVVLTALTLPLWFRSPGKAVLGAIVALVLVALPFVGGYVLTPAGHRCRAQWAAYARHIRENGDLGDVDPAGVTIWGPYLAYGAALGEAPTAVAGLVPAGTPRRAATPAPAAVALVLALVVGALALGQSAAGAQAGECAIGSRSDFRRANPSARVIQRRMPGIDLSCQDLSGFDFGQADMHGANLRRARLDEADFIQTDVAGADFSGASMIKARLGQATASGARFDRADLTDADLTQATLTDAKLPGANLTRAHLGQAHLERADLTGAVLREADLTQAEVAGAVLNGADLTGVAPDEVAEADRTGTPFAPVTSTDLPECSVGSKTSFADTVVDKSATLSGLAGIDLSCQDLTGLRFFASDLKGAKLAKVKLSGTEMFAVDMTGLDLRGADLSGSELASVKLGRADLRDADLSRSKLTSAQLAKADARGAKLDRSDLTNATLDEADLSGASLVGANLTFASAKGTVWQDADLADANGISTMKGSDLDGARNLPASALVAWLIGIGVVLVAALVLILFVRRSRGIAAEA